MGDKQSKPQTVTIDGNEYSTEDFNAEQVVLVNHVLDLDRKINSAQFNLQQLQVGRESFFSMLKGSLASTAEQPTESEALQ